jgi:uncharacterized membrane protein HdeD (DUF308 family)
MRRRPAGWNLGSAIDNTEVKGSQSQEVTEMLGNLVRNWWTFVVQGVLAIGIGVAAFTVPGPTLAAFIAVFAAYAIVSGVFETAAGFSMAGGPKWSLVAGGLLGIAVGVIAFASPESTAVAVTLLVGIYAIATGVARLSAAYMLPSTSSRWLLGLSGVISVAFGVLLIASPNTGVLAVLWLIGYYAIFAGILSIAFGLRLRSAGEDVETLKAELTGTKATTTESTAASH